VRRARPVAALAYVAALHVEAESRAAA
jgi:hypothetical protein